MPVTFVRWALALYLVFIFLSVALLPAMFLAPPYAWPSAIFTFLHIPAFTPLELRALGVLGSLVALLFGAGRFPRVLPWLLWLCLALVVGQLPRVREIQFDYVGYLVLFFGIAPKEWDAGWRRVGLIVLGASYTYTGLFKLNNENWCDPESWRLFQLVLRFPEQTWMLDPHLLSVAITVQVLALPGVLWRRTALATWTALTAIQLWILFALMLEHISIGVLIVHLAFLGSQRPERAKLR